LGTDLRGAAGPLFKLALAFYLNIPLGLLGLGLTWWVLRDWPRPAERLRLDWLGTAVLTICLLSLNVALLGGGDLQSAGGFAAFDEVDTARPNWALYLLAAVALLLFVGIQRVQQQHVKRQRVNLRPSGRPRPCSICASFANPTLAGASWSTSS
jgi:hypothetical protein